MSRVVSATGRPAQQLAEVLAVLVSSQGEEAAIQRGIERIAECFEAEVGALVRDGAVAAVIGFPAGRAPESELLEAAAGRRDRMELPGVGSGSVVIAPVEMELASSLVLVRSGEDAFDPEELSLLRGMAQVLALALRMLRMVDSLQQSEEHSRAILHYADDAFISMDAQGRIAAWNEQAVKTFGWSETEALGSLVGETLVPPQHRRAHRDGLAHFLATGEGPVLNQRMEITAWRNDKIEIPVELAIWPVFSNGAWSFNAFVRDISERRRAEETLRRNERRLADAQEIAQLGSWEWDAAQGRVSWSDQLYRVFDRPVGSTTLLDDFVSSVYPDDRPVVDRALTVAAQGGERFELDCRISRLDGEERVVHVRGEPVFDADGAFAGIRGTGQDITERQQTEAALRDANQRLQELASTDVLTGLPNRGLFSDRLDQALALGRRENREVAVLFIDIDRFKDVNDSMGHRGGDDLLVEVSRRVGAVLRDNDTMARLGGDEFAVLLSGTTSPEGAAGTAERIVASFRKPFSTGGIDFFTSASVGVALWPEDCNSKAELLQHADVAMYRAKGAGGDRFEMFQPAMTVAARDRLAMESELRRAIDAGEFFLRYHPQVNLASGAVVGVEALVRWAHPSRGEMMPLEFIPLAEDTGLIVPIGAWVVTEACQQSARWRVELAPRAPLRVAVNVSARQLTNPGFVAQVIEALAESGIPPGEFELEITESTFITDSGPAVAALKTLRQFGINLAVDDFGTGYSSLGQLQRFPVDRLKLDMSFIAGLGRTERGGTNAGALVAAAVDLAHALGIEAIAEGVETEQQRSSLVAIGADLAQGFLWTRPLRGDEFTVWLAAAG